METWESQLARMCPCRTCGPLSVRAWTAGVKQRVLRGLWPHTPGPFMRWLVASRVVWLLTGVRFVVDRAMAACEAVGRWQGRR